MTRRPDLYLVEGCTGPAEDGIYRLRAANARSAPAEAAWPEAGAFRDLIHRLLRVPLGAE